MVKDHSENGSNEMIWTYDASTLGKYFTDSVTSHLSECFSVYFIDFHAATFMKNLLCKFCFCNTLCNVGAFIICKKPYVAQW